MKRRFGLQDCVGILDACRFPLRSRPAREDVADFLDRNFEYSLKGLIVCDDRKMIRYCPVGWGGKEHESRIWQDTSLGEYPEHYFCPGQYVMADSAFRASRCVVPAFARSRTNVPRPREHDVLHKAHEAPRRISNGCIALLQGRFPWLRSIPLKLTDEESSMRKILMYIESCMVLHNLLVQLNDQIDPEVWGADLDEFSDVDDPGHDESDLEGSDANSDADDLDPDTAVSVEAGTGPAEADTSGVDPAQPLTSDSPPGLRRRQLCRFLMEST